MYKICSTAKPRQAWSVFWFLAEKAIYPLFAENPSIMLLVISYCGIFSEGKIKHLMISHWAPEYTNCNIKESLPA